MSSSFNSKEVSKHLEQVWKQLQVSLENKDPQVELYKHTEKAWGGATSTERATSSKSAFASSVYSSQDFLVELQKSINAYRK